jgi:hypothetical protein
MTDVRVEATSVSATLADDGVVVGVAAARVPDAVIGGVPGPAFGDGAPAAAGDDLLVNGDLRINQRAFGGGDLAAGTYGYDRWKAGDAGATVSVAGDVVTLAGAIEQVLEAPGLAGARVTLSVEDPDGELQVDVGGASGVIAPGSGRIGVVLDVPASATGDVVVRITAGAETTWRRAMLVRGGAVTPWRPRHPALETILCRRYYQRISYLQYQSIGAARVNWNGRVDFVLRYLQPMRAVPAISLAATATGDLFEVNGPSGTYFTSYDGPLQASEYEATISLGAVAGDYSRPAYVRCTGPQDPIHFELDAEL